MTRYLSFLAVCICLIATTHAQHRSDTLARQYTIPIEGSSYIPIHKFSTQIDALYGTARLAGSDEKLPSFYGEVKGYYFPTGAIYVCTGLGMGSLNSRSLATDYSPALTRHATTLSIPSGVGFTMGDDRANFFSGINFTPVLFLETPAGITDPRKVSWGFMPEFGFRMKVGPRDTKGIQLGLVGQLHLITPPSKEDVNLKHCSYAGAGLVIRFY